MSLLREGTPSPTQARTSPVLVSLRSGCARDCPEEKTSFLLPYMAFPKVKECCVLFHFRSGPELRRVRVSSKVLETVSEAGLR